MELVDVLDSKSCEVQPSCRFDPGHRHHKKDLISGLFYLLKQAYLQTLIHSLLPEIINSSSQVNSIAVLQLPHAGKTVLNRFNEISQYVFILLFSNPNGQTPPIGCVV